MRLAVFTNQFPGHTSSFFARDVRALLDAGMDVQVFPLYPLDARLWGAVPEILSAEVFSRDRVHHISPAAAIRRAGSPQLRRIPTVAGRLLAIERSALKFGPDCCLKSGYAGIKAWAWAGRFPRGSFDHILAYWGNYSATCAYLFHQLTDPGIPFSMFVHARMDLYQKQVYLAEKLAYADNVFLVCEFNRQYLKSRYPGLFPALEQRLYVHHLGLELDRISFGPSPRPRARVLAVGRLERLKGHHHLLSAIRLLRDRGLAVELELAGGGEEAGALRSQARALGIEDQVTFHGWLEPAQVMAAMSRATVLAHPSIRPDAMPTVVKESLAVGTPVVASDLAGIPEMLDGGRCGVLVPPDDPVALAGALERLLADESLRLEYATLARQHAEQRFDLWLNGRRLAERLRATPKRENGSGA